MSEYYAFGPDAEVLGQAMLAFVNSTQSDTIHPLLDYHNLTDVQPDDWYPQQVWLDVFSDLSNSGNAMFDFVSVGMQIVHTANFSENVRALPFGDIIMELVAIMNGFNRGEDAGYITCKQIGLNHVRIVACVPYPDDFLYGVFYGAAQEFLPTSSNFAVQYDGTEPCRERGGEATVIHIIWEDLT